MTEPQQTAPSGSRWHFVAIVVVTVVVMVLGVLVVVAPERMRVPDFTITVTPVASPVATFTP